jgi:hypothetical protein
VATSSREMASGARYDFLEECWATSNFRKVTDLGPSLAKRLRDAVDGRAQHTLALMELSSAFDPATIEKWRTMVKEWYSDPVGSHDPFQIISQGMCYDV